MSKLLPDLRYISAPMINQSDLPFRLLVHKHGATLTYTQMLHPNLLLNDKDYRDFHSRDLQISKRLNLPVVVQLCGNDAEVVVKGARTVEEWCDGFDLNLGCPQEHAREGHYGAYLLGQNDWPAVQNIISSLSRSFPVPISAKLRLTTPPSLLTPLAGRLHASGASWLTLHARHVSARRRRHGPADLSQVKKLREELPNSIKIVSNGNVHALEVHDGGDMRRNLHSTGADGIMVGEGLLANPCLFANKVPNAVDISLSYISLCHLHARTASLSTMQTHVRHFIEVQCGRKPWYTKFRVALSKTQDADEIQALLEGRVKRWSGFNSSMQIEQEDREEREQDEGDQEANGPLEYRCQKANRDQAACRSSMSKDTEA